MDKPLYEFGIVQGSEEWHLARSGCLTATSFGKLVTPVKKQISKAATVHEHACEIAAIRTIGSTTEFYESRSMERGKRLEPEARSWYEYCSDQEVEEVGLVRSASDARVTCSPDGLIGDDGGLEIKCLEAKAHVHILWMEEIPAEYWMQIQGNIMVTQRDWWDFVAYHPLLPPYVERVYRDNEVIEKLNTAIPAFMSLVDDIETKLRELMK